MIMRNKYIKFIKYVLFAIITTFLNIAIYLLCYNYLVNSILISNIIAYTFSITAQFLINKSLVFKNNSGNLILQITLFLAVKCLAFFIDSAVLVICFKYLHINNFISKLIANCSTTISNYSLNNKLVFKNN